MWKETILAQFQVLFQNLPEGTEEKHLRPQDSRYLSIILKAGPPEWGVSVIHLTLKFGT
jgi:hypothetical protein